MFRMRRYLLSVLLMLEYFRFQSLVKVLLFLYTNDHPDDILCKIGIYVDDTTLKIWQGI